MRKEKMLAQHYGIILSVIAALLLCTSCTGINQKQLDLDPIFAETQKMSDFISRQRTEFFQQKDAYIKTRNHNHLERMREMTELMRDELERAQYFQQNTRYYRKGMDYERWKSAEYTYTLCHTTLCEMMLVTGEMHMIYWDKEYAAALFTAVVTGFENETISACVDKAKSFLQEMEESGLYAASKKSEIQAIH